MLRAAPTNVIVRSIGLDEALAMWFSGQKLDGLALYGLSVIWWARFAKIATYTAGLVVVLDLIGPERIRQFGARARRAPSLRFRLVVGILFAALILGPFALSLFTRERPVAAATLTSTGTFAGYLITRYQDKVPPFIARVLENPKSQLVVRVLSVFVLTLAFFVDLLTS